MAWRTDSLLGNDVTPAKSSALIPLATPDLSHEIVPQSSEDGFIIISLVFKMYLRNGKCADHEKCRDPFHCVTPLTRDLAMPSRSSLGSLLRSPMQIQISHMHLF